MSREAFDEQVALALSEATWSAQARRSAGDAGFDLLYHTHRSDRSDPGWFDEVWAHRRNPRILYLEMKRQEGRHAVLTMDQIRWLDRMAWLRDCGNPSVEVYGAVRPLDRDALIVTLFEGRSAPSALHQWCLDLSCERCGPERARAKVVVRRRRRP